MAHLKTETLFEDLKTDIEQLAGYAAQHDNYGAAWVYLFLQLRREEHKNG